MTSLWIETTHHAAFRYGGWAYARDVGSVVSGMAGGERNITAGRLDLLAILAALNGLGTGLSVTLKTSSPSVLAALRLAINPPAPGSDEAPTEDLDLWAKLLTATKAHGLKAHGVPRDPKTAAAFLFAWAEVGQDKAKTNAVGRFSAAIPKPNLAKVALA